MAKTPKIARPSTRPLVSKEANFPFKVAVVSWVDLLGYGSMISDAHFNPLHEKASFALKRLRRFHEIIASKSDRLFPTLVMNDGAVAYRDLSFRDRHNTYDFLVRSWELFTAINEEERNSGFPGARMIMAAGFRVKGRRAGVDTSAGQFHSIMRRLKENKISAEQAVREAAVMPRKFDIVPELQANFAFTKAYVAESAGSAKGFSGPRFFIDLAIFRHLDVDWILLEAPISWSDTRLNLSATFAPVVSLSAAQDTYRGSNEVRDGLEVAQYLAGDLNVLEALRAAIK